MDESFTSMFARIRQFLRFILPGIIRPMRVLWNEVIGFVFLALAVWAMLSGVRTIREYEGDGDSIFRLFYDTVKGGDFRSRESNVYRLAQLSLNIIDQCVAQGVPFAREYGGTLAIPFSMKCTDV